MKSRLRPETSSVNPSSSSSLVCPHGLAANVREPILTCVICQRMPLFGASKRATNAVNAAAIVAGLIWSARPDRQTFKVVSTALPFLLKDILVIFWLCFKMGACLFVAELASTALAAGWLGVRGLGGWAQASWVAGRKQGERRRRPQKLAKR